MIPTPDFAHVNQTASRFGTSKLSPPRLEGRRTVIGQSPQQGGVPAA